MVTLYSPSGKVLSVMMLQVAPEQLAWNVPISILWSMLVSVVLSVPQSSVTVPSNAMVSPSVLFMVSFGSGRAFVNCPTKVKFSGSLTLSFKAECPVVPPFQACCPRK